MSDGVEGPVPQRIVVIGTTGSGKTTLAKRLALALDARHIELDALYHEENWRPAEPEVFRERIRAAIDGERWVADGAYASLVWDVLWTRAETIVWLDFAFPLVIRRLLWRSLVRGLRHEELWNGNRESLRTHFMTSDSLLNWARKSHWKHRRAYPLRFADPSIAHVRVLRMRSPREAEAWARAIETRSSTTT
jgi:adenylate kinase family enzyme